MHHLLGIHEIGKRLGVTTARAFQIAKAYDDFPRPMAELAAGRVWATEDVDAWIARHPDRRIGRPRRGQR